jgi:ABC-type multidrug transport system fused ATPase/permease subunit
MVTKAGISVISSRPMRCIGDRFPLNGLFIHWIDLRILNTLSVSSNIVLSDIHFTALFTPLYSLTFILLLCLPHCIVWHSLYCSVYLIVLSDIHFTALFIHFIALFIHFTTLFTPLYCLSFTLLLCLFILVLFLFILLLCLPHCFVWHSLLKMNKQSSKMNKQSSKMNVRQYNGVNRAVKWMSDNTMR